MGEGFPSVALPTLGDSDQHSQEFSDSDPIARLFRDDDSDRSFEGFPNSQTCVEAVVSSPVFPVRQPPSSVCVAPASGRHVLRVCPNSCSRKRSLQLRLNVASPSLLEGCLGLLGGLPPDPDTLTWLGGLRLAAVSC